MRLISNEERRARLAIRHRLAEPAADVVDAARAMIGLHSSDPATVYLSARARVGGMKRDDLDAALYDHRTLVRILAMRRTMFVVPVDLAPLLHHSSSLALAAAERRRLVKMVENAGIAKNGNRWVDDVASRTLAALEARGEAVATELTRDVPELGEKITFYRGDGSVLNTVGLVTRVLFLLATEGNVIRGRPKGSWVSSFYRWAPMDLWLGGPMPQMTRAEAQADLLRLWLAAFGPGTELDMKWWTGWPVTQVRAALAAVGAVEVEVASGPAFVLPDDLDPVGPAPHWVALVPGLDPTSMGWKEREWYLGAHYPRLFDGNGNAGQTIWVDGRIVGGWGQRESGEIVYELLEEVGAQVVAEIEHQADELRLWIGDRVIIPRFRSPSDSALGQLKGARISRT